MKVFYYGGKFDPVTRGHLKVIRRVVESQEFVNNPDAELHIGVKQSSTFPYTGGLCWMVRVAVEEIWPSMADEGRITVIPQDIDRTWLFLQSQYPDPEKTDLVLVMGSDRYEEFNASYKAEKEGRFEGNVWRNAIEISDRCKGLIMPVGRDDGVSSSKVREIFRRDPYIDYDKVRNLITRPVFDVIKRDHAYGQLGYEDDYRQSEACFIKGYDMSKFPRPSVTVDNIVVRPAERGTEILLIRRGGMPYKGFWALPGGFLDVEDDLSLTIAAARELAEETGITNADPLRQFRTYGDMGVDPRGRIVDVVFHVRMGPKTTAKAGDDATELAWFDILDLPRMAFNHRRIIEDYIEEKELR